MGDRIKMVTVIYRAERLSATGQVSLETFPGMCAGTLKGRPASNCSTFKAYCSRTQPPVNKTLLIEHSQLLDGPRSLSRGTI
jgi:hypothetical protein